MLDFGRLLKAVDPEPILVDQHACLRARHRRSSCRACTDVCTTNALSFVEGRMQVSAEACTRCGLCAGACPTAALKVRGLDEAVLEGATRVRCHRAAGSGVELPCLGFLSVDHIVDLGSRCPGLELASGDCAACTLVSGGEQIRRATQQAALILDALGVSSLPQRVVILANAPPQAPEQRTMTRRELFGMWRQDVVHTGQTLVPERAVNPVKLPARVPARRQRWLKRFTSASGSGQFPWPSRRIKEAPFGCNGCNICVAFCPTGALAAREADGVWRLTYQAAACVDCSTCVNLCPRRVMSPGDPPGAGDVLTGNRDLLAVVASGDRPWPNGYRPVS